MEKYLSEVKLSEPELWQLCKSLVDETGTVMAAHRFINRKIMHLEIEKRETNAAEFDELITQWREIETYFINNQETFKIRM